MFSGWWLVWLVLNCCWCCVWWVEVGVGFGFVGRCLWLLLVVSFVIFVLV